MFLDRWMDLKNMVYAYSGVIGMKKERNLILCSNMNELWGHCTKWNKLVTEGQILQTPIIGGI